MAKEDQDLLKFSLEVLKKTEHLQIPPSLEKELLYYILYYKTLNNRENAFLLNHTPLQVNLLL